MVPRTGLFRSRTNRVIGGVASGLAYHLNTDPTLIRIIFLLLAIFWGGGVLLYIILWIALPEEDFPVYGQAGQPGAGGENPEPGAQEPKPAGLEWPKRQNSGALVVGLILIAVGAAFLVERFVPRIDFGHLWPIILVIAGLVLIFSNFGRSKTT